MTDNVEIEINLDTLTVGESDELEDRMGMGLHELFVPDEDGNMKLAPGVRSARLQRTMVFLKMRRDAKAAGKPLPSWDDTYDMMVKIDEEAITESLAPPDPTKPLAEPPTAASD